MGDKVAAGCLPDSLTPQCDVNAGETCKDIDNGATKV